MLIIVFRVLLHANISMCITSFTDINSSTIKNELDKREKDHIKILRDIVSIQNRLIGLEESSRSVNKFEGLNENLQSLDTYIQQILNKINLNQASIIDLSKLHAMYKCTIFGVLCIAICVHGKLINNYNTIVFLEKLIEDDEEEST